MKHQLPMGLLVVLLCAVAQAQLADFSAASLYRNSSSFGSPDQQTTVLTGKVVSEEGFALRESVPVFLECGGRVLSRSYSDNQGNFNLTFGVTDVSGRQGFLRGQTGTSSSSSFADCELYGEISGYQSEHVRLSNDTATGIVQVGAIVLHPISPETSFSISVSSLAAPEKAKRALEKGREQEKSRKWAAAAAYFKRAIEVYPRYALAWVELGRTQVQQNSFAEARESFQQSVDHDTRFAEGYAGLAYVALQQDEWKELADATEHLVEFAPNSPQFWFLNALASFNLGNTKQAQTSLGRGLRLDPKHQIPDMEYLYGLILARNHDYEAAIEHVTTYLRLAPNASNADAASRVLAQFKQQVKSTSASR